jgi:hypothetical protein
LQTNSVGTLTIWVAALVLVVAAFVALAHKGRHAGWFHPLSLPLYPMLFVWVLMRWYRLHITAADRLPVAVRDTSDA